MKILVWSVRFPECVVETAHWSTLCKSHDFYRSTLPDAGHGDVSTGSSLHLLIFCTRFGGLQWRPNPCKSELSFKKGLSLPTLYHFAFLQGGFGAVFLQALPKRSPALYLIIVLWTLPMPPANFTAPEPCLGDRHCIFPQSVLKALPSGIFSNLWLANGCHVFRTLQPENSRVVVQKCLVINKWHILVSHSFEKLTIKIDFK